MSPTAEPVLTSPDARQIARRIDELARKRNQGLMLEAMTECGLGVVFTILTFGFIFLGVWLILGSLAEMIGLTGRGLALIVVCALFGVSVYSAWRQVDPLAAVDPMTDMQEIATYLSMAVPGATVVSPRHATAGIAAVLIGGPANLFDAWATWRHRLTCSTTIAAGAADLLIAADRGAPMEAIKDPRAAILLKRLALIKAAGERSTLKLATTQNGRDVIHGRTAG